MRTALLACFLSSVAVSTLQAQVGGPGKTRPNILFLLTDDQRFDAMNVAGHPFLKTPHMDRLAREGVRFRNAFVTTPICAASRASILTGLHERTHKFTFGTPPIAAQFCLHSYPFLLRQAGYRTGLIGKFGVGVDAGMAAKMFDLLVPIGYPYQRKQKDGTTRHIDQIATDKAIEFLKEQDPKKPFCLSISFNSPHAQDGKLDDLYPAPKTTADLYGDVRIPPPPRGDDKHFQAEPVFLRQALNRIRWYWQFDTPEKFARNVRDYYRMISGIDHEIGRLLAELERLGLLENTVVVFLSDNGYFLGERGFSGKWVHYEESIRVPLIIADPRLPADRRGETSGALALNIDLTPTFLALAGLDIPADMQGKNLLPLVHGKKTPWRTDFFCEHLMVHKDIPQWEGVRGERYVYAKYFGQKPPYEFLHDLQEDPHELRNLAGNKEHAPLLERLRRRTVELRDAYGGPYSLERFPLNKSAKKKKKK